MTVSVCLILETATIPDSLTIILLWLILLPDEETDCTRQADKERLAWLDMLAGDKFEDLGKYKKEIENFSKQFDAHE